MHATLRALRQAVAVITEQLDSIERSLQHVTFARHADCITHDLPLGHDTVLGYLAKHDPDVLDQFDYSDPRATQRDGFWLMRRAQGNALYVEAPPVLRAQGIEVVRAYPIHLLAQRFGD